MKKLVLSLTTVGLLSASGIPLAADSPHSLTGNVGLYSQYIFRGLTQTDEEPALQGGLDYTHSSGFYLGAWGSNVSWLTDTGIYTSGSLEIDVYGGFRGGIGDSGLTYDLGVLQYLYPGDVVAGGVDADTTELYAALGWKWFTLKYSYSLGDTFGLRDADGSDYWDLSATFPLAETGLSAGLHYGIQKFEGTTGGVSNDSLYSYDDWKVSLSYDLGKASPVLSGTTLGIMYTDTDAKRANWTAAATNTYLGDSNVTFWISRAF